MNIEFKLIEINNFRSIKNVTLELNNQGIVIVKGYNEYEDNANSNGSGKSSLFEAIIYCLFEETSNGEKDVVNRIIRGECRINLVLSIGEVEYQILRINDGKKTSVRVLKNNEDISARNKTDTNKLISNIIGVDKNVFLDSVFLSQGLHTNLASLSPTARKERLEVITNTDNNVNEFKDKLRKLQDKYEEECKNNINEKGKIDGKIENLVSQQEIYRNKITEIEKQIAYRDSLGNLDQVNADLQNLEIQIRETQNNFNSCDQQILEKDNLVTQIQIENSDKADLYKIKNQLYQSERLNLTSIESKLGMRNIEVYNLEKDIKRENKEIEKILNSDVCPTCGRKYNLNSEQEEHIKNQINDKNLKIKEINNQIKNKELEKEEISNQIKNQEKIVQKYKDELDNINQDIEKISNKINIIKQEKQVIINQKYIINKNIQELEYKRERLNELRETILNIKVGNKQEFQELLDNSSKELLQLQDEQYKICELYNKNNDYVGAIKQCIQLTTKEFRTYLLQSSIEYLNKMLEKYSRRLFSNDTDTIKIIGNDTKLDITLGNASYESLSGGERTRVDIALLLAQKSLAGAVGNISFNIIILDEILGYCDSQAEESIINLVLEELSSLESIFLISHKEITIGFDKVIWIVKNKEGLSNISYR